jgi:DNA invertase Pin-like site-specific DNA recombinase
MLNKGDILLVYQLSRVARSLQDSVKIDEIVESKGAALVSATEYAIT